MKKQLLSALLVIILGCSSGAALKAGEREEEKLEYGGLNAEERLEEYEGLNVEEKPPQEYEASNEEETDDWLYPSREEKLSAEELSAEKFPAEEPPAEKPPAEKSPAGELLTEELPADPPFTFKIFDGTDGDRITGATEEDRRLAEELKNGRIFAIAPIPAEKTARAPEDARITMENGTSAVSLSPGQYVIHSGEYFFCDEIWTREAVRQGNANSTVYRYVEYLDSSGVKHSSPLYCMNAVKRGLNPGTEGMTLKEAAYRFMTNSSLKKILYFGCGGPGDICGSFDPTCEHVDWSKWSNRFFYTHMALSIEYSGDYNMATLDQVRHVGLLDFMEKLKERTIPSRSDVKLRGRDTAGNAVTTDALRTPMTLYMSKPDGYDWLESRFAQGFQRTGILTVQDEGRAGNGIRMTKPPGADYQLIYWSSLEEYKSLGMDNPHVLGDSEEINMRTGFRFCFIFPKNYRKTLKFTYTMLLYPIQYLFVDGNTQTGDPGDYIQDFGAFVYTGSPGQLTLTILPAPFGRIRVAKTDFRTGEPVSGAVYQLLAAENLMSGNALRVRAGTVVGEGTTTPKGVIVFKTLIPGKYKIRETEAAEGYLLDTRDYTARAEKGRLMEVPVTDVPDIRGRVLIEKLAEGTSLHLSDAEFTVYAWSEKKKDYSVLVEKLIYKSKTRRYVSGILQFTEDNMGKFRVRETKNPAGYTGSWHGDFVLEETGTKKRFTFQVENTPMLTKKVEIRKIDSESRSPLPGAEFTIYEYDRNKGAYDRTGTLFTYDENAELYSSGELTVTDKNAGRYLVRETKNPSGYEGDWERELDISAGDVQLQYTVENTPVKLPEGRAEIIKKDSLTGEKLEGAEFKVCQWNSLSRRYEDTLGEKSAVKYISEEKKYQTELLEITADNQGRFKLLETKSPPGYTGSWEQEILLSGENSLVSLTAENDPERLPTGSIRIVKKIPEDEILWAHGNPVFRFAAEGRDQQGCVRKYENYLRFSPGGYERDEAGYGVMEIIFRNVPLGTYEVYEKPVLRYYLQKVQADTANVTITAGTEPGYGRLPRETAWGTAVLTLDNRDAALTFFNKTGRCDGYSHSDVLKNTIPWGTETVS